MKNSSQNILSANCWPTVVAYMRSEDGVKKPILQFKEDQGDRYERYDPVRSTDFLFKFLTLLIFIFTLFSVDLWST